MKTQEDNASVYDLIKLRIRFCLFVFVCKSLENHSKSPNSINDLLFNNYHYYCQLLDTRQLIILHRSYSFGQIE